MKHILNTLILSLACIACQAQLYDTKWGIGEWPLTLLEFTSNNVTLDSIGKPNPFFLTDANICDEQGVFLYNTNGIAIYDKNGDTLQNGTGINPCDYTNQYICCGLNILQAALFIPQPGNTRYYYLFHFSGDAGTTNRPATIYYSLIDREGNGGLGSVIRKNDTIFHTSTKLRGGGMTACKHANGRDYWLVMGDAILPIFYKFLITPNGIEGPFIQTIGPEFPEPYDNAYSKFSQDGSKYVTGVYEGPILVMDFDRCSGEFSNPVDIYNESCPDAHSCSGSSSVEISPNNRFVYVATVITLTQYDLWSNNIQDSVQIFAADSSQIAELSMMQLAPNGKIYISTWGGEIGFDSIHVINNPNAKGDSCNFVYGGQPILNDDGGNVPNLINYKLSPLTGSGCDTITTAINNVAKENDIRVYPNPAKNLINLTYPATIINAVEFDLIDELGNVVMKRPLGSTQAFAQFSTGALSNGLYYWVLKDSDRTIKTGKVAIMK